jgi:hypothetical protein
MELHNQTPPARRIVAVIVRDVLTLAREVPGAAPAPGWSPSKDPGLLPGGLARPLRVAWVTRGHALLRVSIFPLPVQEGVRPLDKHLHDVLPLEGVDHAVAQHAGVLGFCDQKLDRIIAPEPANALEA